MWRCKHSRRQALSRRRIDNSFGDKCGQRLRVELLQLAAAASSEMTARWHRAVRSMLQRTIGQQHIAGRGSCGKTPTRGYPISFGGYPQNLFGRGHG
jgi:hypothetical protein